MPPSLFTHLFLPSIELPYMLKRIFHYIIAEQEDLTLEERLFITAIVLSMLFSAFGIVFIAVLIPSQITIITLLILTSIIAVIYYFARFKRIIKPLILPTVLIFLTGISIVWIFGGGINGPNLFTAMVILIFSLMVVPKKYQISTLLIFLTDFISLHLLQHFNPQLITDYASEDLRLIDTILTLTYACFVLYVIISFVSHRYTLENRKVKESELRIQQQNQELQKLNADKDRFMQILAHDLRSPFHTLLGFSRLLVANVHQYEQKKIDCQLQLIHQTSLNTYNLLTDLLLWSQSQSGVLPFEPRANNLRALCLETISLLQTDAQLKNIEIKYLQTDDFSVCADANMLKTILRNLISNALKFTNPDGFISISAEKIGSQLEIGVTDNGVGISPEIQQKLWDSENYVSMPGTNNERGTGLGLMLCREFVEKHGGTIQLESQLNKGSRFLISLPQEIGALATDE